ncbi:MAG: hypothetical protein ACLQFR_05150 [Streptosporangiaceae bacterium]
MRITLLGPQRRPTLGTVVASLHLEGPVATVTAGWQEREKDDGELRGLLGFRDVNLSLYRRWLDVLERDPGLAAAERRLQEMLEEMQDLYLLRLDHALQAVYAVQRRNAESQVRADAIAQAIAAVRDLDAAHLLRISRIRDDFYQDLQPHDRPAVAEHRADVARLLSDAAVLVVAGGHVGVLADALHLFNVAASLRSPVIAWSAGAMALTDRIVLFHDRSPQGPGQPELYGSGLSVLRGVVPLPHPRARLLLDDTPRMAVFARRFAPAHCILLDNGTRVDTDSDGTCPPDTRVLAEDGRVTSLAAA